MEVGISERPSPRDALSAEIDQLRAAGKSYEEVTLKRQQLLENYAMTMEQIQQWHDDGIAYEENDGEYGILHTVFYQLNVKDHSTVKFAKMYLDYYLKWLIAGPPEGFEDLDLFQDAEFEELLLEVRENNSGDFQHLHLLLDIHLRYLRYKSGYTLRIDSEDDDYNSNEGEDVPIPTPQSELIDEALRVYQSFLQLPHEDLDRTVARLSNFISANCNDRYDACMQTLNPIYSKTKKEQFNVELIFTQYRQSPPGQRSSTLLQSLLSLTKRQVSISIFHSAFQNEIIETNTTDLWMQYTLGLYVRISSTSSPPIHEVLVSFTRHHPQYIPAFVELLRSINRIDDFQHVKLRITQEGLLNHTDSEQWIDLIVSYLASGDRCGYSDDQLDHFLQLAIERDPADVFHSIERAIATIYEKRGDVRNAKRVHLMLTKKFPSEAEGWLTSYHFERRQGDVESAKTVLVAAVNRAEQLDWPERIFEEATRFEELYWSPKTYYWLKAKIEKKKLEVEEVRAAGDADMVDQLEQVSIVDNTRKRKLADSISDDGEEEQKTINPVRKRELFTIAARNLPLSIDEKHVRNFFKDCGTIRQVDLIPLPDSLQANVEFTDPQDVLRALTKDYKTLFRHEIRVQKLEQTTVFVTNFPPTFGKEDLEEVFKAVGPVSGIRLPSLKFNSQRRFAYVEYVNPGDAKAAVALLNDEDIRGFTLSVQISDPSSKKNRSGATEEGREVYITKLDYFKVNANKVKQLFEKYGTVENVHLPLSEKNEALNKKHDGYGFVTFSTSEEAQASLALNMVTLEGRVIEVSISQKKSLRAKKQEVKAFKNYSNSSNAIGVANLPDTISAATLKELFEDIGTVEDVVLEPKNRGAIVVFQNDNVAGNASLKLEGSSIGDYKVQIVSVKELKKVDANAPTLSSSPALLMPSNLRRKRMLQTASNTKVDSKASPQLNEPGNAPSTSGRSNADFRAMFLSKK